MSNFMGPMAPPQAAPTQPPQLDIRTNPNQRERFRDFMRQNTRPNLAVPAMQPPMMPQAPMPMAPQAPRPPIPMAIRPNAPMPAQPAPMPYGGNIDVFSPQYMNQSRPMYLEDGGSVPPRRTEIRGQDHMLSYITPKEAGILKALGGTGEAGPMGIPSYPDAEHGGKDSAGPADSGGSMSGPGDMGGGFDSGYSSGYGKSDTSSKTGGQDRSNMEATLNDYNALSDAQKASDFAKAEQAGKAAKAAQEAREARELVARTFVTSNNKTSLVGAPNSKLGYVTSGKPSDSQIAEALAAAKSLGMDISNVDPSMASELGLDDTPTTAVEAVSTPTEKAKKSEVDLLLDIFSMPTTPQTTPTSQFTSPTSTNPAQQTVNDLVTAAANASTRSFAPAASVPGAVATGTSSTPATDFFADAYSDIVESVTGKPDTPPGTTARGIMDIFSDLSMIGIASNLLGLDNQFTAPRASAKDRAGFTIGELLGLDERAYDINDALESGMFDPKGGLFSTGKVTGIQPPGLTKGFFSTNPFGMVVYSGMPDPNYTGPYANLVNPNYGDGGGGDQPYIPPYIPPVVEPVVNDGTPNVFGGMGDDGPYQPLVQNYTGDGREQYAGTLRMPVGYGDPRTGYIAPQAFTTTGFAPPPRGPIPIGFFEDGGEVLDQAAGRFLEALTAA